MAFQLTYADVELCVPTPEIEEWVDRFLPLCDLRDVTPVQRWPGKNLTGLAFADPACLVPTPKIGQLFWPCGLSRWAVGRFLATGEQLFRIKNAVIDTGATTTLKTASLVMQADGDDAEKGKVTATGMTMLPPRPLSPFINDLQTTGAKNDLYLITLVDDRYFLQYTNAGVIDVLSDQADWEGLMDAVAADFLAFPTVAPEAVYLAPSTDSSLYSNYESVPLLLDAVLANVGRVAVKKLDGTYAVRTMAEALTQLATVRWAIRTAGGNAINTAEIHFNALRLGAFPKYVDVTFPKWVDGFGFPDASSGAQRDWIRDSYNKVYRKQVDSAAITSHASKFNLNGKTKTFHTTARARYASSDVTGAPTNQTELDDLAKQLAKDYLDSQMIAGIDELYAGIVGLPTAASVALAADVIWSYRAGGEATTRIMGRPWNLTVTEFSHGSATDPVSDNDGALCQVTGAFTTVATEIDMYPATIKKLLNTAGTITWVSGANVWLVQRFNFPLTSGSCFMGKKSEIGTYTISGDTRPVYMTSDLEWC